MDVIVGFFFGVKQSEVGLHRLHLQNVTAGLAQRARSRALNTTSVGAARGRGRTASGTVFVFNEPTDNGLWGPWRDMTQIALSSDWD